MSTKRLGGRSAIVREKVLSAARELVAAKGLNNVTIPEIAQSAGVAATSLYRRWGKVNLLLLDMSVEHLATKFPVLDKGRIEDDLISWSETMAGGFAATEECKYFRILLATSELTAEERLRALAPRQEQLEQMIERSKARGEKPPSIEDIFDHIISPLTMRALLGQPVNKKIGKRLARRLLSI